MIATPGSPATPWRRCSNEQVLTSPVTLHIRGVNYDLAMRSATMNFKTNVFGSKEAGAAGSRQGLDRGRIFAVLDGKRRSDHVSRAITRPCVRISSSRGRLLCLAWPRKTIDHDFPAIHQAPRPSGRRSFVLALGLFAAPALAAPQNGAAAGSRPSREYCCPGAAPAGGSRSTSSPTSSTIPTRSRRRLGTAAALAIQA